MAIIVDIEENPRRLDIPETIKLVDLAFYMCGGQSNGIMSNELGGIDLRPLSQGGSEVWNFLKKARSRAWQKVGYDPTVLRCPERADDICVDGTDATASESNQWADNFTHDLTWGSIPQTEEDWLTMGTAADIDMPLIGHEFGFE